MHVTNVEMTQMLCGSNTVSGLGGGSNGLVWEGIGLPSDEDDY